MAISRMDMERQMRNMGGIMGLEDQRQGYFLGKLVKKVKKGVKKVVKSPLGKLALGAAALKFGGPGLAKLLGRPATGFLSGQFTGQGGIFNAARGLFDQGNLLAGLVRDPETGKFSLGRAALSGLGAASIAAPFFMGGDEEEDTGTPFTSPQADIEDIRSQAKAYYSDPTNSALYFMPPKAAVQSSFYADGGLASMRPGYRIGGGVLQKAGQMIKSGVGKVKSLFDDADISIQVRDEDVYVPDYGYQAQATGQDVFLQAKSKKSKKVLDSLIEEGYDITKGVDGDPNSYSINALDEGALDIVAKRLRLGDKGVDEFMGSYDDMYSGTDDQMIYDALRQRKADGGIMDLGGLEKDYREGGFVPLGAEERADDVPARLSKT